MRNVESGRSRRFAHAPPCECLLRPSTGFLVLRPASVVLGAVGARRGRDARTWRGLVRCLGACRATICPSRVELLGQLGGGVTRIAFCSRMPSLTTFCLDTRLCSFIARLFPRACRPCATATTPVPSRQAYSVLLGRQSSAELRVSTYFHAAQRSALRQRAASAAEKTKGGRLLTPSHRRRVRGAELLLSWCRRLASVGASIPR